MNQVRQSIQRESTKLEVLPNERYHLYPSKKIITKHYGLVYEMMMKNHGFSRK